MMSPGRYGLAWNPGRNTPARYGLFAMQIIVVIVLSWLGIMLSPISFAGVGLFYWAEAFIVLFTLWWGVWGVVGTYIGTVVGAGLFTGLPLTTSLALGISDTVAVIIAFVIYRSYASKHNVSPFGTDILGKSRALWLFILWIVLITNVIGGFIGVSVLLQAGAISTGEYLPALGAWIIGDAIMLLIFLPVMSRYITPALARRNLLTEGWFS